MTVPYGKVLRYTLLPGFIPRLRELFLTGFSHIAYTIALIYGAVRLLPADHPYLDPQNVGRYGIRHVIAQAARNLTFSWRNIDQIAIFFIILIGMVLLAVQFGLMISAIFTQQPAMAGAIIPFRDILSVNSQYGHNGNTAQDLAFIILDRVFGTERIYFSCVEFPPCMDLDGNPITTTTAAYPNAFHTALHSLFHYYSLGIFMVSIIVILYFVTTIVGETAVTGSPFGQRFNKTWGPVRLILFFALLMPLNIGERNEGFNAAQLLTFYVAKLGSNFATNAWGYFNQNITDTYLGQTRDLVATTSFPQVNELVRFMFIVKTCKIAEEFAYNRAPHGTNKYQDGIQPYIVRNSPFLSGSTPANNRMRLDTANYAAVQTFVNHGNIEVRFGAFNDTDKDYANEKAAVKAVCGDMVIPTTSADRTGGPISGAVAMQELYFNMIKDMWNDPEITTHARCVRNSTAQDGHNPNCAEWPGATFTETIINKWQTYLSTNIPPLINQQITNSEWGVNANLKAVGWAGAAIWYNRIAQMNGAMTTAIFSIPQHKSMPLVMETIAEQNTAKNSNLSAADMYDPLLGHGQDLNLDKDEQQVAVSLNKANRFWQQSDVMTYQETKKTNNIIIDGVNTIFGTQGIFDMRKNTNIHPLAQLSALGKGMMDAAIRNLGVGMAISGVGGLFDMFKLGGLTEAAGGFLTSMGKATILMGFILYYVLPFMPFIYFMFAVSGWVKSIFEAIVAMPLWALAHISRMDGQGMPGPGANSGYFLILEIFLRPILITFGLLASITAFSAIVYIMNNVFDLVVANATGFNMDSEQKGVGGKALIGYARNSIDEFFFTAIYVILVYMLALSFFKMIDQIPNNILRWMGVSVSTFNEAMGDPAGQLTGKIYQGGSLALNQIRGGGQLAALLKG